MTRYCLACLLACGLAFPPSVCAATAADVAPNQDRSAVFLALDAVNARVTYRTEDTGAITTSPVSSPATLEKLAKLRGGQKVILKCRATQDGQLIVEGVKKKPNWLKRGIILGVIAFSIVAFLAGDSDNLGY
jgi:hypothetical protein